MIKERILLKVYRSRKVYAFFYVLMIALVAYIPYTYYIGEPVGLPFLIASIVIILVMIKTIEVYRLRDWWAITDNSFIESKSIFNKNVREIDFQSIADIALDQPFYKRIFDYGTVEIRKFMNEATIVIPNINRPEKFINILRDAIMRSKKNEKK